MNLNEIGNEGENEEKSEILKSLSLNIRQKDKVLSDYQFIPLTKLMPFHLCLFTPLQTSPTSFHPRRL